MNTIFRSIFTFGCLWSGVAFAQFGEPDPARLPGLTPLMQAAIANDANRVQQLLSAGANKDELYRGWHQTMGRPYTWFYDYSAVHFAIESKSDQAFLTLVRNGAQFGARAIRQFWDFGNGQYDRDKGDIVTPFGLALRSKRAPIVQFFLEKGMALPKDEIGEFVSDRDLQMVQLFLDHGYEINYVVASGQYSSWTLAHFAAANGAIKVMELVFARNANLEIKSSSGNTPLLISVMKHRTAVMDRLIARKINVNVQNQTGSTPLHIAATELNETYVTKLLAAGARKDIKDNAGKRPWQYATARNGDDAERVALANRVRALLR